MLQNIRDKSHGIVVKIIVGFIVVTFALFGVDALVTGLSSSNTVAEVNGTEISRTELLQAAETQRRQLISMMGADLDPALLEDNLLQRRALDELIQRTVLANHATSMALAVSDAQVDQYLLQAEQFKTGGQFDQNKYLNFIRSLGYTPLAFKQRIKQDILLQQTRSAVSASEFVLPSQINAVSELQNQTRSYDYVEFDLAAETEATDVTDDEVAAYFNEHTQDFKTAEQVTLDYVVISSADFESRVSATEAELQAAYKIAIAQEPAEERLTSHILIEENEQRDSADAQALILQLQQKLLAGESFASLASQYSDDIGSKNAGGDLGYVTKGTMVEAFETALFAMKVGDVVEVETEFGLHLIQLKEIITPEVATLDELKDDLQADILTRKAKDLFLSAHEDITDLAYASDGLDPLANEYQVSVLQTDLFSRQGGTDQVSANAQVIAAAFSPELLEDKQNSSMIELNDDQVVVVRVNQHYPESNQSLEEARDQVVSLLIQAKAKTSLAAKAELAKANLTQQNWTQVELAKRGEDEIASLAFTIAHPDNAPEVVIKDKVNGSLVLIRLNQVTPGSAVGDEEQAVFYKRYLNQIGATLATQSQQALLTNTAEIER